MPYRDREQKRAYDRAYRRGHREKANVAGHRYLRTAKGMLNKIRSRAKVRIG